MATKINATPSNDVNFDANATFNDDFSKWLTEMVAYWPKTYTGCTFEIAKVGTEPDGLSVEITTKNKPNQTSDCLKSLNDSLSSALSSNKITTKNISTESKNAYSITWNKGTTPKKETTDKDKDDDKKNQKVEPGAMVSKLFGGAAEKVMGGIQTGFKALGEEHENNTKLLEEIDRIKELIK